MDPEDKSKCWGTRDGSDMNVLLLVSVKKKKPHLVRQSSCVVRDKMKVCLEEIQVTVMYILWREVKSENVTVWE